MLYLDVPFREKDAAKALGARWDPMKKKWYISEPDSKDLSLFADWMPVEQEGGVKSDDFLDLDFARANSRAPASINPPTQQTQREFTETQTETTQEEKGVSLSQFLDEISEILEINFPQTYWVKAEIASLNQRNGHLYLELSENNEQGQSLASIRAMAWAGVAKGLQEKFQQATGETLQAGQKVLLRVKVNFHAIYGLSLVIHEIDPNYTLGDIEANLNAIRKELISKGIYGKNKELIISQDIFKVAVVAPESAAGLGDFKAEADKLVELGLCAFHYFYATFQGDKTLSTILQALDKAQATHQEQDFDALVIIRGGGSRLDLNYLNQYKIAEALALFQIPVFSGIGHERDNTILDEVAHTRFDTPSKVVQGIGQIILQSGQKALSSWQLIEKNSKLTLVAMQSRIEQLNQQVAHQSKSVFSLWVGRIDPLKQGIEHYAKQLITQEKARVENNFSQISYRAQNLVNLHKQQLDNHLGFIQRTAPQVVLSKQERIKQLIGFILSSGPQTQLKRGFAVAKTSTGVPITSAQQAESLTEIDLSFHDGNLKVVPAKNIKNLAGTTTKPANQEQIELDI